MMAVELRRRGVDVVVVEQRERRAPWAKAVGLQPRTLEIWDAAGLAREVDWDLPPGYGVRASHQTEEGTTDTRVGSCPWQCGAWPRRACWTATTPRATRSARKSSGAPCERPVSEDVAEGALTGGARPGMRAPAATGLRKDAVAYPLRWHDLLRHPERTLLQWAPDGAMCTAAQDLAVELGRRVGGAVRCPVVAAGSA
ncbi:MAG: FAD-dependent monooxygenase [Mycobacteriaceae bacterium]